MDWLEADDDTPEAPSDVSVTAYEWAHLKRTFATLGFREGAAAGEEAALQGAFNAGFREGSTSGAREGAVLGAVGTLIDVLPLSVSIGYATDVTCRARLHRVRHVILDKLHKGAQWSSHDIPTLPSATSQQEGYCCQRQQHCAASESNSGCHSHDCCQRHLTERQPQLSFIESPFNTKVEYEAWLRMPASAQQGALEAAQSIAAAKTGSAGLDEFRRLDVLVWAGRELQEVQAMLLQQSLGFQE